ncbi:Protein sel-1 -like protein 1 [Escovopsis weberi]|uniref:Protein sel-1-like protein 1 n=1 Tax=Escovopsis weberi TaxID=150374 RepID=A0A0M8N2D2_ESCWE|nr:Protein sel-1 -like protein 1 [Escovopsis weberi]
MRPRKAWLLSLLQASAVVHAHRRPSGGNGNDDDVAAQKSLNDPAIDSPQPPSKLDLAGEHFQPRDPQPGSDLVDAALADLSSIPRARHRRQESTSIFAKASRLLLGLIPTSPVKAPSQPQKPTVSGPLLSAVENLGHAARLNNSDALYILAELNFYGNYSHPRNLHAAFDHYEKLASGHGNTTAQYMLGVFYSTGLGDVVPRDQAKALLYYTFAAIKGDARAEMATAFRHQSGIGASKHCETAITYYKRVADKAIEWYRSGPPGGRSWVHQGWRIADDEGGVYGEGASVFSSGMNAFKPGPESNANAAIGDVIEFLDLISQKGDSTASFNLGRIYYEGQRGLDQNFELARKYFLLVASRFWKKDGRLADNVKKAVEKPASKAAGYLGRMYLRGDGVAQNFDRARFWFERGISQGDAMSQYGLGLMLLHGHGGTENVMKAIELLKASADQDYAPAQVQMGQLYLDQGGQDDVRIANNYFELAVRYGHIEASYYLAELIYHGLGRERHCNTAANYYKNVAEKAEPLVSSWADANDAYESGDYDLAFLEYLLAAEQGYERAQTNVAYMLDSLRSKMPVAEWLRQRRNKSGLLENPPLALIYWTRAARQSNIDALVKMGDYYFYGVGTERDIGKAVQCYTGASDYSQSAQALFNLGWMHENGIGLTQDFHLAKRYYDHALQLNDEAYLPVTLGLMKLRLRSAWNTLTHGPIHSIQDEPKSKKDWSLSEWIANFLQEDGLIFEQDYFDDMYDGQTLGGEDDLMEGGLVESVLIVGITMSLLLLLWWRGRMQQRQQQQQQQAQRNQQQPHGRNDDARRNQGQQGRQGQDDFNPNDPFPAWAAGGLGF